MQKQDKALVRRLKIRRAASQKAWRSRKRMRSHVERMRTMLYSSNGGSKKV
jgi:hypothetical protein